MLFQKLMTEKMHTLHKNIIWKKKNEGKEKYT